MILKRIMFSVYLRMLVHFIGAFGMLHITLAIRYISFTVRTNENIYCWRTVAFDNFYWIFPYFIWVVACISFVNLSNYHTKKRYVYEKFVASLNPALLLYILMFAYLISFTHLFLDVYLNSEWFESLTKFERVEMLVATGIMNNFTIFIVCDLILRIMDKTLLHPIREIVRVLIKREYRAMTVLITTLFVFSITMFGSFNYGDRELLRLSYILFGISALMVRLVFLHEKSKEGSDVQ